MSIHCRLPVNACGGGRAGVQTNLEGAGFDRLEHDQGAVVAQGWAKQAMIAGVPNKCREVAHRTTVALAPGSDDAEVMFWRPRSRPSSRAG